MKIFIFNKRNGFMQILETYEKKEADLTELEKGLILGELMNTWNRAPHEI